MAFQSTNTIKSNLVKTRPVLEDRENSAGFYSVKCGECDLRYVGETSRNFKIRLREHKDDVRLARERNAIYKHIASTNHAVDWTSSKMVYHSSSKFNRLIVEPSLIKYLPNYNNMQSTLAVDNLTRDLVLKTNPKILENLR